MKISATNLKDCIVIEPEIFEDDRGFFMEIYHQNKLEEKTGIKDRFVQDNFSRSYKGVLRGLHYQIKRPQGKLVRVVAGEVFDVAVDLRPDSSTFKGWFGINISEENKKHIWIPPGFAHGFFVLSDFADFEYKCTDFYDPNDEGCIIWNDPDIDIKWPTFNPIISHKDASANLLKDLR